jgi:diguanylate cyclase (GGDEF)-like protein
MTHYESYNLFENLLTSIASPFFIIDEEGTFHEVYVGTLNSLTIQQDTLRGKKLHEVMKLETADFFLSQIQKTLHLGVGKSFEYELSSDDLLSLSEAGEKNSEWYQVRMYPLELNISEKSAVTVLMLNISDQKDLQQRIRDTAFHDLLTQSYNRAYFFERLSEQLELYTQQKIPVSIMIVDIDNFKDVNNTFGYFLGDHLLKDVADVLHDNFNEDNYLCARIGSDEFVISMKGLTIEQAMIRAQNIRESIQKHVCTYAQRAIVITVSIGVSTMMSHDTDATNILNRADKALMQAKLLGKNRVERADL